MRSEIRQAGVLLKNQDVEGLCRKSINYIYIGLSRRIINHLESKLNSNLVLSRGELRSISSEFEFVDININQNISSEAISGNINDNFPTSGYDVVEDYDPLTLEKPYVCVVPDSYIVGRYPVGFVNYRVIPDTVHTYTEDNYRLVESLCRTPRDILLQFIRTKPENESNDSVETGVLMTSHWNHYGHFVMEHVLKFRFIEEYTKNFENLVLIVENDFPSWKYRYLELLGYGDAEIKKFDGGILRVKNLVVPSYPELSKDSITWLRERIYKNADKNVMNAIDSPDRVWISRQNIGKRCIVNYREVVEKIKEYDFHVCHPEELTIDQQIAYFSDVDFIAGPHGSGFTNMIYSQQNNITVLELFGQKVAPAFFRLADILGYDYNHLLCSPQENDIYVNIQDLCNELDTLT